MTRLEERETGFLTSDRLDKLKHAGKQAQMPALTARAPRSVFLWKKKVQTKQNETKRLVHLLTCVLSSARHVYLRTSSGPGGSTHLIHLCNY